MGNRNLYLDGKEVDNKEGGELRFPKRNQNIWKTGRMELRNQELSSPAMYRQKKSAEKKEIQKEGKKCS